MRLPLDMSAHTPAEIRRWAHERRPAEREAPPQPGERLLLRQAEFAEPVTAVVLEVQDMATPASHWRQHGDRVAAEGPGQPDPTVWVPDGPRRWRLHDDPWPWARVQVVIGQRADGSDILGDKRWCKEARVRGSGGWLREGSRAHTGNYEEA